MKNKYIFNVFTPVISEERFDIEVEAETYEEAVLKVNEKYDDINSNMENDKDITPYKYSVDYDHHNTAQYGDSIGFGKVIMNDGNIVASDPVIEMEDNLKSIYGEDYFLIKGSELVRLHMTPNPNNLVLSAVTVGDIRENISNLGGDVDLDTILSHRQNITSNIDNDRVRIDIAQSLIEIFNDKKKDN